MKLEDRDYFTDFDILREPYAFFEAVRSHGPIYQPAGRDYLIVTGFEETLEVLRNAEDFSASIGLAGAGAPLPFEVKGPDITADIEANRAKILGGDLLVNYDDDLHTRTRALLNPLFTPRRLKANEAFINDYCDKLAKAVIAKGECEIVNEVATPFVTVVIADLLGVPQADRDYFMEVIAVVPPAGSLNAEDYDDDKSIHHLQIMGRLFAGFIMDRRAHPKDDILTEFSTATYPDGSRPDLIELTKIASFLFAAGQDTSAKLLGNALRYIVDQPGLQDRLRADPSLIPLLIEEVLRLEGSTKQLARVARRATKIGNRPVPVGTKILLAIAAANRDPIRWPEPHRFELGRPKIKEHVAFGRGRHTCAGAPLARVEVRIILEKLLAYTSDIDLVEEVHGARGSRKLDFEPSFIIRGLEALHVRLTPAADFAAANLPAGTLAVN